MSDPNYDPSEGEKQETSDAGVGGAVYKEDESVLTPGASGNTQDAPTMDMHATSTQAQIDGIVEQSRADVGSGDAAELERVIRQRLGEARIDVDDAEITALAAG